MTTTPRTAPAAGHAAAPGDETTQAEAGLNIKSIQVLFPLTYQPNQKATLHLELQDDKGNLTRLVQQFTREEWEQIAKGRGYWHR